MIEDFSKAKRSTKNNNRKLDSSGMDIPGYAYERMARCLLPIMRTYFESEEGKIMLREIENEDDLRRAA